MSNIAIRVENLGKLYRIGGKQERYYTLRDTIVDAVSAPFRRVRGLLRGESAADLHEEIWALKDVSFEVKHGDVVGIIGRNGAGKSTLLKILSRITEPTTGYADIYGRVGALLEVGTGFHPELTGRENIYLNGAILGMSRAEINRKFDEIVDFAGVERFIDTPVKHYSSGMGLRLGFAVAAHLEPEILIVDEVLAVGDAEFQKKCLGKMSEVAGEGRTVLFVSHNMAAVRSLCNRGIVLAEGSVIEDCPATLAVDQYLTSVTLQSAWLVKSMRPVAHGKEPFIRPALRADMNAR
ncbi:MAG: ABC transporter ATP-binding protein, partial [Aggregatilineales bacterium]